MIEAYKPSQRVGDGKIVVGITAHLERADEMAGPWNCSVDNRRRHSDALVSLSS